jgi:hypothetical protein
MRIGTGRGTVGADPSGAPPRRRTGDSRPRGNGRLVVVGTDVCADLGVHRVELAERGYTVVPDAGPDVTTVLSRFGRLVPQYDGAIRQHLRGHGGDVGPHTEAPGWPPPPRYVALHCRTPGGRAELGDGAAFFGALSPQLRAVAYEREIVWPGRGTGGVARGVRAPLVQRSATGRDVLRFSYNLLTGGRYEPATGRSRPPLGALGVELAQLAAMFFELGRTPVTVPVDAVLVWDSQRMFHTLPAHRDYLRFWLADDSGARSA